MLQREVLVLCVSPKLRAVTSPPLPRMLCVRAFLLVSLCVAALCSLQDRQTDFGLRVFSQMADGAAASRGENLAFSPYGVATLLGMVQLGAGGSTRKALRSAMGFSLQERGLSRQQRRQQQSLSAAGGLEASSAVMVERLLGLEAGFRRALLKAFRTAPHQVDFSRTEQATDVINAWVSDRTAGMIPQFLAPGALTDETRLVLLNALHFQGLWKLPFDPKLTQERMFHCSNGSSVPVAMMRLTAAFRYGEFVSSDGLEYLVVEVPYEGDALSMFLVQPFEADVPAGALVAELSSQRIGQWSAELRSVKRRLALPRFSIDSEVNLKAVLTNMGLGEMFNLATADFSRITTEERLSVSAVLQRVKIEVNEEGTKAAAASGAIMFSRMGVEEIALDTPFLFLIQHKATGAVLFMGQVNQPEPY
uniref:Plasminogen activator inhibitor 1 n=2 Tax=Gadus morhua TaxID=8049 RepID=A0A8C5CMY0_GADMO